MPWRIMAGPVCLHARDTAQEAANRVAASIAEDMLQGAERESPSPFPALRAAGGFQVVARARGR